MYSPLQELHSGPNPSHLLCTHLQDFRKSTGGQFLFLKPESSQDYLDIASHLAPSGLWVYHKLARVLHQVPSLSPDNFPYNFTSILLWGVAILSPILVLAGGTETTPISPRSHPLYLSHCMIIHFF
ncbi:hypothetical protein B0H10DRAFT_2087807 [Mycena sp. CBHHK59/15]|nr:hypothetical protein B0H10DRAFT_2087807 [Mycena sp. CBHHK59/15]